MENPLPLKSILQLLLCLSQLSAAQADTTRESFQQLRDHLSGLPAVTDKVPPHVTIGQPIRVSVSYSPFQILHIDEVKQNLALSASLLIYWNDSSMAWKMEDYNQLDWMKLPNESIWRPPFYIVNAANEDFLLKPPDTVEVRYTGEIRAGQTIQTLTSCFFDLTFYPFDKQNCSLILQPLQEETEVVVDAFDVHLPTESYFSTSGEWILEAISYRSGSWSSQPKRPRSYIIFDFQISRRYTYYVVNVMMPMIVTSLMTLIVFFIPASSGEKISVLVSLFVSTTMFLNVVSGTMPRSMIALPRFNAFLIILLVENLLVMISTVVVLRRYHAEQEQSKNKKKALGIKELMQQKFFGRPRSTKVHPLNTKAHVIHVVSADVTLEADTARETDDVIGFVNNSDFDKKGPHEPWYSSTNLDRILFLAFICISLPVYVLVFIY